MPGEIIGETAIGVLRFIGRLLGEVLFELLIKRTGYSICRRFRRDTDPDGALSVFVGLAFWLVIAAICVAVFH